MEAQRVVAATSPNHDQQEMNRRRREQQQRIPYPEVLANFAIVVVIGERISFLKNECIFIGPFSILAAS